MSESTSSTSSDEDIAKFAGCVVDVAPRTATTRGRSGLSLVLSHPTKKNDPTNTPPPVSSNTAALPSKVEAFFGHQDDRTERPIAYQGQLTEMLQNKIKQSFDMEDLSPEAVMMTEGEVPLVPQGYSHPMWEDREKEEDVAVRLFRRTKIGEPFLITESGGLHWQSLARGGSHAPTGGHATNLGAENSAYARGGGAITQTNQPWIRDFRRLTRDDDSGAAVLITPCGEDTSHDMMMIMMTQRAQVFRSNCAAQKGGVSIGQTMKGEIIRDGRCGDVDYGAPRHGVVDDHQRRDCSKKLGLVLDQERNS